MQVADGVVVASAIIRRMLNGGSLDDAIGMVADLRAALDSRVTGLSRDRSAAVPADRSIV